MNRLTPHVTLLLPGLEAAASASAGDPQDIGLLSEKRLAWSDIPGCPWEVSLQRSLGFPSVKETDIPMARALGLHRESVPAMCADLVHLKADRDTASLVPGRALNIDKAEADELIESMNEFVGSDGLLFERAGPNCGAHRWLLTGFSGDALAAYPPDYLAERSVSAHLTESDGDAQWRRWQTEWQMLLHNHPVNQKRMMQGQLPINSLWLWGGGALPESKTPTAQVYSNDDNAKVLCEAFNVPALPLSSVIQESPESDAVESDAVERILVVDTGLLDAWIAKDLDGLVSHLQSINQELLPTLVEFVDKHKNATLTIVTDDGHQAHLKLANGWLARLQRIFAT